MKRKKATFLLTLYVILSSLTFKSSSHKEPSTDEHISYNNKYCYESIMPYASYSKGNVYICSEDNLYNLPSLSLDDVVVVDERYNEDPNMKIINSCDVNTLEDIKDIIAILLKFEAEYPSSWNRSRTKMVIEWITHNIGYFFDMYPDHTTDVDLNNADEHAFIINSIKKMQENNDDNVNRY